MGLVKTIYNVLGGFYMDYNSTILTESVHKLNKSLQVFLCTFSSPNFIITKIHKNMHKKTEFFRLGFVFVNFRNIFRLRHRRYFPLLNHCQHLFLQKVLRILLWKSFLSLKEALHSGLIRHDVPK